jgi:hypothetical protein
MKVVDAKQKFTHEMKEMFVVFLFLAPFSLAFATYRMYLEGNSHGIYFYYGLALINALVLAKIILIGELAGLGRRSADKPLMISILHKSAVFALFFLIFHVLESAIREVLHGQTFLAALNAEVVVKRGQLAAEALLVFFAFIPFFALLETRRVLGPDQFLRLLFGRREPTGLLDTKRRETA